MKVVPVRRFKVKAAAPGSVEKSIHMAVLSENEEPAAVVVLARRDLIFLQRHFRRLDHNEHVEYGEFSRRVTDLLTELTRATNHKSKPT